MYEAKIKGSEFTFRGDLVHELSTGRTFLVDLDHFENDTPVGDILVEVEPDTVVEVVREVKLREVRDRKPKETAVCAKCKHYTRTFFGFDICRTGKTNYIHGTSDYYLTLCKDRNIDGRCRFYEAKVKTDEDV